MIGILALFISPLSSLKAEDYPVGYLGSGYREYLSNKIQNGYYVEEFTKLDLRQKERVDKRNQVEEIISSSYVATPISGYGISAAQYQQIKNSDELNTEIALQRIQRNQNASAKGEFNYVPYSDGSMVYFKDGLVSRMVNERVVDEFGNVGIKNTYNMQYNDKRLLIGYEADIKDNLGNTSHQSWTGNYTPDSVFYGGKETNANKNLAEYTNKVTDSKGDVTVTNWQALSYEGKFLRAFSQVIEDSIYGITTFTRSNITYAGNDPERPSSYHEEGIGVDCLAYNLDRSNTNYNDKGQLTGYQEIIRTTQKDGNVAITTVEAKFKYLGVARNFGRDVKEPEPDRILESIITTTIENPDGSTRTETTTTTYNYNDGLVGASGYSEFSGQEAKWFEYKDAEGHILSRSKDEKGKVTYSYLDWDTQETVFVSEDQVTATLKDGNKFSGTSQIQFKELHGKPMLYKSDSLTSYYNPEDGNLFRTEETQVDYTNGMKNNLQRLLSTYESTKIHYPFLDPDQTHIESKEITTLYAYDEKGNLIGAQGTGIKKGYEYSDSRGWAFPYTSRINIDYGVTLGKALQKEYNEVKNY